MHILLLEDDTVLAAILANYLKESYEVTHTYSMVQVLSLADVKKFNLEELTQRIEKVWQRQVIKRETKIVS